MNGGPPPPPPPPHGAQSAARGGLPDGNYDIFIIPPHSAGSGFLYLPSLQPHRNSFLAGVGCTLLAVSIWTIVFPVLREWFAKIVASGGMAVIILLIGVGVAGWAWGKTQIEGAFGEGGKGAAPGANQRSTSDPPPGPEPSTAPPPPPPPPQPEPQAPPKPSYSWQRSYGASAGASSKPAGTGASASSTAGAKGAWEKGSWERAREETRKREEERRKAEELRKKREEEEKERIRQREKDAAEREAREKREREARERARASAAAAAPPSSSNPRPTPKPEYSRPSSPNKRPPQPTAKTATDDDAFSYRPYDNPKKSSYKTSASSIYSESSYAPSHSTARTTPPPSHRGPYKCKDPDKIVIKAVYSFNNTFTKVPVAQLISGMGSVTDGLILRITTEGLFIDDDVRGVPQREWDVKAWTLKLVETGELRSLHVLRASIRDTEGKRYVFVLQEEEGWKVAVGLQRLRRGTQVRALGVSGMAANETKAILDNAGWL